MTDTWLLCNDCGWYGPSDEYPDLSDGDTCPDCNDGDLIERDSTDG